MIDQDRNVRPILLRGGRVIDPSQRIDRTASVLLSGGVVAEVGDRIVAPDDAIVLDCSGAIIAPGGRFVRVFVTGGYGCIGSWVAKRLVEGGREVWIYDLKEDTHRLDLLLDAEERKRVHFLPGDVADAPSVRAAIERVEATHVLHLAGLQTPTCRANPILGATVNVIGTLAIFEAAVALKDQVQRVVYASSAAVHGPAEGETSGPLGDEVRGRAAAAANDVAAVQEILRDAAADAAARAGQEQYPRWRHRLTGWCARSSRRESTR
jgi:hypothetical protein